MKRGKLISEFSAIFTKTPWYGFNSKISSFLKTQGRSDSYYHAYYTREGAVNYKKSGYPLAPTLALCTLEPLAGPYRFAGLRGVLPTLDCTGATSGCTPGRTWPPRSTALKDWFTATRRVQSKTRSLAVSEWGQSPRLAMAQPCSSPRLAAADRVSRSRPEPCRPKRRAHLINNASLGQAMGWGHPPLLLPWARGAAGQCRPAQQP